MNADRSLLFLSLLPNNKKTKQKKKQTTQQQQLRKYLFALVFVLFNAIYITDRCVYYSNIVDNPKSVYSKETIAKYSAKNGGNGILTGWFVIAKMFGNLLDVNCAFILFPEGRSFICYLYNKSTDQRRVSLLLNFLLSFMPLDSAIQWHKMMAFLIVIGAVFHTYAHYMHYGEVPYTYDQTYGATVWISGVIIIFCMQFLYCTSFADVRHGKFEMFWYTHHVFIIFFITILLHGQNSQNPNFWKWFVIPGMMYLFERTMREVRSRDAVGVVSITHLNNNFAKVFCLELQKKGPIKHHQEGQYIFVKAPMISEYQWHPFTISSPPEQKTLTLHIRNMGPGTWTDRLQTFFQAMSPHTSYYKPQHRDADGLFPQKYGPDGNNLICIDGPMAAPTQHLGEYSTVIVAGAGIGVTPVHATLQSIVYYRFKRGIGQSFPDNAYCVWIVNHSQLDAYRWMARSLKEAEDEIYDMREKHSGYLQEKSIEIHVYVTSVPNEIPPYDENDFKTPENDENADLGMWGPHYDPVQRKNRNIIKTKAPFNEFDIWRLLHQPNANGDGRPRRIGDIFVHSGRPKWKQFFQPIREKHGGDKIGVMFCGPEIIARDLKVECANQTRSRQMICFAIVQFSIFLVINLLICMICFFSFFFFFFVFLIGHMWRIYRSCK